MNIIKHNYDNYKGINEKIGSLPHQVGHSGSWFGLPDFGITEAIGGALGGNRNAQGGSEIVNDASPAGQNYLANTRETLGANTQQGPGGAYPIAGGAPTSTQTSGGTSGGGQTTQQSSGGGGSNETLAAMDRGEIPWDDNLRAQLQQGQQDINQEIQNAFNSQMGFANQVEQNLRGQFPEIQNQITNQYQTSQDQLQRQQEQNQSQIGLQEEQGEQRKENAQIAARRLYNELLTGGQQRFGGASSAGEAFQALSGREFQRNSADIQQNFGNFMGQINQAKQELSNNVTTALENVEMQKNQAMNQARTQFQNALQEVDRLRGEAAEQKANRRLQALQDLRNNLNQVNLAAAEMRQQAQQYAQQQASVLDQYADQAGEQVEGANQAGQQLGQNVPLNFGTGLGMSVGRGPTGFDTQTGRINLNAGQDEDELVRQGLIAPNPRDEFFDQAGIFAGR